MKFMTIMMLTSSIIIVMMRHPLSLGLMLMIQTTMMCVYSSMIMSTSWFGYILFITIIGGLMIMFMYMSSIASNEKFKTSKILIPMMILTTIILTMTIQDPSMEEFNKIKEIKLFTLNSEEMLSTSKFLMDYKSNLTILIMMILLLTMVAVTNISNTFEGPLKKPYV
uniref:NADH-ubiquinone oxidoreductase chain 6 n=1 Tax=Magadhaideus sp. n. SX-2018 TaxID=2220057 RepID=A0A451GIR1_9HEMI|nr:NADH dehydrogenase subunit 6 [Magadhaideus sp. n. SX-2018]